MRAAMAPSRARLKSCWSTESNSQASEATVKTSQCCRSNERHHGCGVWGRIMEKAVRQPSRSSAAQDESGHLRRAAQDDFAAGGVGREGQPGAGGRHKATVAES